MNPKKIYLNKTMKSFVVEQDYIKDFTSYDEYIKSDDIVPVTQDEIELFLFKCEEKNDIAKILNEFQKKLIEKIKQ